MVPMHIVLTVDTMSAVIRVHLRAIHGACDLCTKGGGERDRETSH